MSETPVARDSSAGSRHIVRKIVTPLASLAQKARAIAENIDDQVESFRTSIDGLREMVDSVTEFERRLQERIEEPILDTVGTIAAVIKGFQAFFARLRA